MSQLFEAKAGWTNGVLPVLNYWRAVLIICLFVLTGCSRFFPGDPANPGLGMIQVGDHYEIRLPSCATGRHQKIYVTDSNPSASPESTLILWQVDRPWPAHGGQSIVLGEVTSGMHVTTPSLAISKSVHPNIVVGVAGDKQAWEGAFDLRNVGPALTGGLGRPKIMSRAQLDKIGGC
jgi:hypothetical protein